MPGIFLYMQELAAFCCTFHTQMTTQYIMCSGSLKRGRSRVELRYISFQQQSNMKNSL